MAESDLAAALKGWDVMEVVATKGHWSDKDHTFRLYENGVKVKDLNPLSVKDNGGKVVFTLPVSYQIKPGNFYQIADCKNEFVPVDLTALAGTSEFDRKYRFDGPMGAIYQKDKTVFRLFSPLATEFYVKIRKPGESQFTFIKMERLDSGVYQAIVDGDLDSYQYLYFGKVNGRWVEAVDPYAYSANANSRLGFVIDPAKALEEEDGSKGLSPFGSPSQAVIYEADVRDLTSKLDLPDRGTFNALARTGLTFGPDKIPAGLDYIKGLGVTHVQLLPLMDFQTVDDSNPRGSYNWGYDPLLYFAPEGSYSSDPDDAYKRITELRHLVHVFHENGLRIVMDVVFNHVFDALTNPLEVLCPGYYFRLNNDGTPSNGSFCGNDFESRHFMAAKLIKDALLHYLDFFGVDGFRFDLMAIIDRKTLADSYQALVARKKDLLFYGEGWDMPTALPSEDKSSLNNAFALPFVGFFNDRFRDFTKGPSQRERLGEKGYLTGDLGKIDDFKYAYAACSIRINHNPLFQNPLQSIDYVECHDNNTLYDKLKASLGGESETSILERLKMINAIVVFGAGIPFIHAGQEIGATKNMNDNTFDAGDDLNGLDYGLAVKRWDYYRFMAQAIAFRKANPDLWFQTKDEVQSTLSFENIEKGCLLIRYGARWDGFHYVFINPGKDSVTYTFKNYVKVVFRETGLLPQDYDFYSQTVILNGYSVTVCYSRDEK